MGSDGELDRIAESYVRLVLGVGEYDPHYVDAYYGPAEWRDEVRRATPSLAELRREGDELQVAARAEAVAPDDPLVELRRRYLVGQLGAVVARIRMLQGEEMTFDQESRALYDAEAPHIPMERFDRTLSKLDALLPGEGSLNERYDRFRAGFVIPEDRLDKVFSAAIEACRDRTRAHLELPERESFEVEYVTGQPWSAYNWYQGHYHSLIQVNTELPIHIERALHLACHEGYPGHHVYNSLLEEELVRDRGWMEYTVYPLFSPQSLIAEGSADYGLEMAFPGEERVAFERETLFPLAGLDPAEANRYYQVQELVEQLAYAGNEAARGYLNGDLDAEAAAQLMVRYLLYTPARAAQRVRFFDRYRSYVINYNLGEDLVRRYVEARSADGSAELRWQVFGDLLSSPRLPSELTAVTPQ